MITNYSRPQLLIRQILEKLEVSTLPGLNALVFGAQFDLNRVTNAEEFAEMQGVAVDIPNSSSTVQLVPFENYQPGSSITDDYTRLYGKDLEAILVKYGFCGVNTNDTDTSDEAQDLSGVTFSMLSVQEPNKIIARDTSGSPIILETDSTNTTLDPSLKGRPVQSGDTVYVTYKGDIVKRKVISLERALVEPGTNEINNGNLNPTLTFGATVPVVTSSATGTVTASFAPSNVDLKSYLSSGVRYNGEFSERFTIRVTTPTGKGADNVGRATMTSSSGVYSGANIVITGQAGVSDFILDPSASGIPGLTITADKGVNDGDGLFLGDTISVTASLDYLRLDNDNFKIVGDYAYDTDDTLIFEVLSTSTDVNSPYAGSVLRVTDTAGKMQAVNVTLQQDGALDQAEYVVLDNTGLSFRLQNIINNLAGYQKSLRVGDVYTLDLTVGLASGPRSVVLLNGIAGNTVGRTNSVDDLEIDCVEFRCQYSGFIPSYRNNSELQWSADSRPLVDGSGNANFGVNVYTGLKISRSDRSPAHRWVKVASGTRNSKLFTHFKAYVPAFENEAIDWSDSLTSIAYGTSYTKYGKVDVENPLAFGLSLALSGANGRGVFIGRIESNDQAGFEKVLDKAEKNTNIYALCPLTDDYSTQKAVMAHVKAMSTEAKKRWRRAYIGTNSPTSYASIGPDPVTDMRSQATVSEYLGANTRVVDEAGVFLDKEIRAGDLFRTNYRLGADGTEIYDEYKVASVVTNEELILASGPSTGTNVTRDYEIHKSDSAANIIDYVAERSEKFSSRRIVNIWVDKPIYKSVDHGSVALSNFYVAAEIAGLRSAVQPQQGLTNTEVTSVSSAPSMYTKYTEDNLDSIAEQGTWIITQDYEDGDIYIRHQLTTDSDNGSMYYEDSVGTNLDEISYAVNSVLFKYIGKRNATAGTVQEIYNEVFALLFSRTKAAPEVIIGPALLGFSGLTVAIDDTYKDRVNIDVSLELPLPLNSIVVTLRAYASFNEGEAVQETAVSADVNGRLYDVSTLSA